MPDEPPQPDWLNFNVAAALSRQYAADQRSFLRLLAQTLQTALPDETRVEWHGLFGRKAVRRVTVGIGDNQYAIEDPGRGALRATRTRVVRGIALKTDDVPVAEWTAELGAALDALAQANSGARDALARLFE